MRPAAILSLAALSLFVWVCDVNEALECYTGRVFMRGKSLGTQKETCSEEVDQCYRATAEAYPVAKVKLAGCATFQCMASRDTCMDKSIAGHQMEICCCGTDLCNVKNGTGGVSGVLNKLKSIAGFAGALGKK